MIFSENILICIALPIVATLPFIHGRVKKSYIAFLFGMVMCLFAAYLNSFFADIFDYNQVDTAKYISPMVEEIMKMTPIMLYVLLIEERGKDIVSFAIAVGAGFATFENCCYLIESGAQQMHFILIRGLSVGIMHVLCGLVIGLGMVIVSKYREVVIPGVIGAFAFAMTIHALYNLLVSTTGTLMYIGFGVPLAIIVLVYLTKDKAVKI